MNLQIKIIGTVLSIFIISLLFMGVLVFSNAQSNLQEQIINQLESASQITENNIDTFLNEQQNKIELVATQSALSNEELAQMVSYVDDTFYDMFVIDSNGTVVVSSNPERIGLYRGDRDYFVNARNQTHISNVYFALVPQQYSVSVSTPFHEGVLVGAMSLEVFDKLVSDKAGFGKTGENLLAFQNENGSVVYFGTRLFSDKKIEVLTAEEARDRPVAHALRGEQEVFSNILDYRGVEVLAATNKIERTGMGLVAKIDVSEAFSKIKEIQRITIFLVLIMSILVGFVIYIISKGISREIKDVTEDINKITKGDLEIQLKKSGIFEIQSLIDSLNRILASMKLAILRTGIGKSELGIGEAIKAKQEAEDRFKTLYESSADAIMTIEPPSWKFTAGNPATLKLYNIKDEKELQTLGPWDLSPEKQPNGKLSSEEAKKMIMKAMKEGSAYFEWTQRKYKGEDFAATVLLTRIMSAGKTFLQATVRDVSEEKKSEENLREAKVFTDNAINSMQDIFYAFDLKGKFIKWNKKFKEVSGYGDDEIAKMKPTDLFSGKDALRVARAIALAIRKGDAKVNADFVTKKGKKIPMEFTGNIIKDSNGKTIGVAGTGREISKEDK